MSYMKNPLHGYFPCYTVVLFQVWPGLMRILRKNIWIVVAAGKASLEDDSTPAQARVIAENNARRNALEEAVGIN